MWYVCDILWPETELRSVTFCHVPATATHVVYVPHSAHALAQAHPTILCIPLVYYTLLVSYTLTASNYDVHCT